MFTRRTFHATVAIVAIVAMVAMVAMVEDGDPRVRATLE